MMIKDKIISFFSLNPVMVGNCSLEVCEQEYKLIKKIREGKKGINELFLNREFDIKELERKVKACEKCASNSDKEIVKKTSSELRKLYVDYYNRNGKC